MSFAAPTAEGEGGAGGRPNLPGIPGSLDRVSAENIWRFRCNSETDYLRERNKFPPKSREHYGSLHGFSVVRHPSYVDIRKVLGARTGMAASTSSLPAAESSEGFHQMPATPAPSVPEDPLQARLKAAAKTAHCHFGTSMPKNLPLPATNMHVPKYRFAYSMEWMQELSANPGTSKSAANLARAMSTPNVRH
eukprot:TRINITY_DN114530_c0_g1_i1.p2 TRINITY_DN114530_c0_g1~~TRINITY_DN114530_c0_g1_i1.p2  ORF type:complete len:192 (+),score=32.35 TRINITY_DN114530_c0_g1_i1:53-628(+)